MTSPRRSVAWFLWLLPSCSRRSHPSGGRQRTPDISCSRRQGRWDRGSSRFSSIPCRHGGHRLPIEDTTPCGPSHRPRSSHHRGCSKSYTKPPEGRTSPVLRWSPRYWTFVYIGDILIGHTRSPRFRPGGIAVASLDRLFALEIEFHRSVRQQALGTALHTSYALQWGYEELLRGIGHVTELEIR
jgi:hypothetical protein